MSQPLPFAERVRKAFEPGAGGILGLVDDLLEMARERPLDLEWRDGVCHVRAGAPATVALPKSVFRAALARLAALCNETEADSVTPYGGAGTLTLAGESPTRLRVSFVNTPSEQRATIQHTDEVNAPARETRVATPAVG